eukprot:g14055.t1
MKRPASRAPFLSLVPRRDGAYPARLQAKLDGQAGIGAFLVKSFGVNGAVAVNTPGKKCYVKERRYVDATHFHAHVHVVMLGTNDAGHIHGEPERVGEAIAALVKDLRRGGIAAASKYPKFVIVQPPGAKARHQENLKTHVYPSLRKVVRSIKDATLVDLELKPMAYATDQVHLSEQGAEQVAAAVAAAIL